MSMIPSVIFPDAELWATGYLRTTLAARTENYTSGVYVSNSTPAARRDRMVIVRRDGGPRIDNARETARLAVNVWATTEQDVIDLTRLVRALLWAAPDGKPICRVDDSAGPIAIPDESKQLRRYFTVDLIVRGTPLTA